MQRELCTLPLPPLLRNKLIKSGFTTVEDVKDLDALELCKEAGLTRDEALEVLRAARPGRAPAVTKPVSALSLMSEGDGHAAIVTFSQAIDEMLGGGVPLSKITEVCGVPGVGKTQMSLQLCVDVQIPECFGGIGGQAVYIDTEGSFVPERLKEMADAAVAHCKAVAAAAEDGPDVAAVQLKALESFAVDDILKQVHYFRCKDYVELVALTYILPEFLCEKQKVKLVVIDSLAFHFRHDFDDMSLRTRLLNNLGQSYIKIAVEQKLAVVFVNQMTTRVAKDGSASIVPALGESWGHVSTVRVMLLWKGAQRYANLFKSPNMKEDMVPYQVTADGIRDVYDESANDTLPSTADEQPLKRLKSS